MAPHTLATQRLFITLALTYHVTVDFDVKLVVSVGDMLLGVVKPMNLTAS